ncbi:MAG: hypothetical protein U9O65_07005 [Thermotogota bacterium]|nr:hypothetical protein [Thermotogota bacterium]
MEKTEFPYQKEDSVLFGVTYRPIVDFEVKTEFGWIPVLAYADSGRGYNVATKVISVFPGCEV